MLESDIYACRSWPADLDNLLKGFPGLCLNLCVLLKSSTKYRSQLEIADKNRLGWVMVKLPP